MNWEQALARRLLNDGDIAAAVATRVDWSRRQSSMLPAIVLETISDPRPQTHDGFDTMRPTRVRVHCLAKDRQSGFPVKEAAIAALAPAGTFDGISFDRGQVDAVRDLSGDTETGFIDRQSIDFIIWHTDQGE
ncbi:MAG: hypothetical protein WA908_01490 [Pontixanthobacter sp.]